MSGSFGSVRLNACVHRLDLDLYSHLKGFGKYGVRTHVNSREKSPLPEKFSPEEHRTLDSAQAGQRAQHTANELFQPLPLCSQCHDQTDEPHTLCLSPLCSQCHDVMIKKMNPTPCASLHSVVSVMLSWSNRWTPHPLPLSILLSVSCCDDQTDEPHTLCLSPFCCQCHDQIDEPHTLCLSPLCCQCHVMIKQMNPTRCASLYSVLSVMITQMNPTPSASLYSVVSVMIKQMNPTPCASLHSVLSVMIKHEPHTLCLSPFCCVMMSWSNRWTTHPVPLFTLLSVSWSHRWTPHPLPLFTLFSVSWIPQWAVQLFSGHFCLKNKTVWIFHKRAIFLHAVETVQTWLFFPRRWKSFAKWFPFASDAGGVQVSPHPEASAEGAAGHAAVVRAEASQTADQVSGPTVEKVQHEDHVSYLSESPTQAGWRLGLWKW